MTRCRAHELLFVTYLVALCALVIASTFGTNLVQGGDSTVSGANNSWITSTGCFMDSGYFSVKNIIFIFYPSYDCYMTQTIDITFARNYLLNPGGRVMISMQGYVRGSDPDYATLNLTLQECMSKKPKYTLGGDVINSSSWNTYTWEMGLPPNICALGVQLYMRNHELDGDKPFAKTVSVILTATPATETAALLTSVSVSRSEEGSTLTRSPTPNCTQSSTLSHDAPTSTLTVSPELSATSTITTTEALTETLGITTTPTRTGSTSSNFSSFSARLTLTSSRMISRTGTLHATPTSSPVDSSTSSPTAQQSASFELLSSVPRVCGSQISLLHDALTVVVPADGATRTTSTIDISKQAFSIVAAPVDRTFLLSASVIIASFDFGNNPRWEILQAHAAHDGNMLTLLSASEITNVSLPGIVFVRLTSTIMSTASPLWLPRDVSVYQSTTVEIQLQLQCAVGHNETSHNVSTLTLAVPSPGITQSQPQLIASSVVSRSLLISSFAGIGAASGGGRLASITVAQCGTAVDGVSGLLPISIDPSCNFTLSHLDDINAIIGNWAVVLVGTAAAGMACAVLCLSGSSSRLDASSCVDAMRLLTFPMCVLPLWVAAVPSGGAAAIHLATTISVGDETCNYVAAIVVTAGLLLVIVPLCSVFAAVWITEKQFTRVDAHVVAPASTSRASSLLRRWKAVTQWAFAHNCEWIVPVENDTEQRRIDRKLCSTRHLDALLSEFRIVGYSALDLVNTVIVSLIAGAALGPGTFSWCIGSLAFSLALFCVQLCICIALRPHITWFYFLHSVATQALAIVSVGLALGSAIANSQTRQDTDLIAATSTASAVINIISVALVSVRTLLDLRSFVVALHRIIVRPHRGTEPKMSINATFIMPGLEISDLAYEDTERQFFGKFVDVTRLPLPNHDEEVLVVDETAYWDADGNYRDRQQASDELNESMESSLMLEAERLRLDTSLEWLHLEGPTFTTEFLDEFLDNTEGIIGCGIGGQDPTCSNLR